ncbi:MAG: YebC/PmpR family DNA-binding transcriptional regulator [Patescibacteria group bacterium]|nr:YebC/PmpR family DNA-binding transcriptional regulator [Patescibacteria group bacterium]
MTVAAKSEPNPQFNPALRSAVDKAKENQVPQDNIERAIKKASESAENLEEFTMEAYGPEGLAIIIEAITDNRNRTVSEVKKILKDCGAKWADPGSVIWAFEKKEGKWEPKFRQLISEAGKEQLKRLLEFLDDYDDVQNMVANVKL